MTPDSMDLTWDCCEREPVCAHYYKGKSDDLGLSACLVVRENRKWTLSIKRKKADDNSP